MGSNPFAKYAQIFLLNYPIQIFQFLMISVNRSDIMGSFGKRVQTVTIWIFSFELENLNWVIWTKNLNYCLAQIILIENIIWIVVWVDVKWVMLSNKKSSWNAKSKNTIQNGFKLLKFEGGKNLILKGLNDFFSFGFYPKKSYQTAI